MSQITPTPPAQLRMVRKAAVGSAVGTTIEAYDFQIYGVASALVFSTVFFSDIPPSLGVVFSFATLSVGFLARPVGAMIFGHFGDKVGRKQLLIIALMGAGGCTTLMGLLPTHAQVGIWAPVLLVALRLLQGIFHGGEQGGAVLMAVEHAPAHRRGWYGSWAFLGSPGGTLLAAGVMGITITATGENFLTWGWRIPFVISFILLGVGMIIRSTVTESPEFAKLKKSDGHAKAPMIEVIKKSWRLVLVSIGVNLGFNGFVWVLISYSLAYGTQYLGYEREFMLQGTQIGSVAMIVAILFFARLSDKIGRMKVMLGGALFILLYPFPMFALLDSARPSLAIAALVIGFVGASAVFGPLAAFLVELFPTKVAYSGVSVGYSLGAVLGGGLAPFIASLLMEVSGGQSWTVALYLALGGAISLISLLFLRSFRSTSGEARNPQVAETRAS
ncbi:MFS transporter [Glutamicibacter sp.]|uniref:MFS transporter n=1 Tax=Glutamicibacter sp. TaxID=1931995 RepID=UPI003D6A45E7